MESEREHQDWTPVMLSGKKPISISNKKYTIEEKKNDEERKRAAKNHALEDESETFHKPEIPYSLSQEIMKARCAMKLTQKELAQKLNLQPSIISNYESGKAIPDHQILQKIAKALNTKFQSKIVKPKKIED